MASRIHVRPCIDMQIAWPLCSGAVESVLTDSGGCGWWVIEDRPEGREIANSCRSSAERRGRFILFAPPVVRMPAW